MSKISEFRGSEGYEFQMYKALEEEMFAEVDLMITNGTVNSTSKLSQEQIAALPDQQFGGPRRSLPIPNDAHVAALRKVLETHKSIDVVKERLLATFKALGLNEKAIGPRGFFSEKNTDYDELLIEHALIHKWWNNSIYLDIVGEEAARQIHELTVSKLLGFTLPSLHEVKDDLDRTLPESYRREDS